VFFYEPINRNEERGERLLQFPGARIALRPSDAHAFLNELVFSEDPRQRFQLAQARNVLAQ
jgi:hypothetical protein